MNDLSNYNYIFLQSKQQINDISKDKLKQYKDEFMEYINTNKKVRVYSYSLIGLKCNASVMLWIQSSSIEDMQELLTQLMHSALGKYIKITYTLFGIKRKSSYEGKGTAETHELPKRERLKYLIIYPFTKTHEWYQLDFDKRKELMHEHIKTGYKYAHIKQYLLYAIGIDDHEFIVSYETESLEDFQNLVMDMRSTKVRMYTLNDLPIYTCVYKTLDKALDVL